LLLNLLLKELINSLSQILLVKRSKDKMKKSLKNMILSIPLAISSTAVINTMTSEPAEATGVDINVPVTYFVDDTISMTITNGNGETETATALGCTTYIDPDGHALTALDFGHIDALGLNPDNNTHIQHFTLTDLSTFGSQGGGTVWVWDQAVTVNVNVGGPSSSGTANISVATDLGSASLVQVKQQYDGGIYYGWLAPNNGGMYVTGSSTQQIWQNVNTPYDVAVSVPKGTPPSTTQVLENLTWHAFPNI
jgi:hypothetical protein